MDTFLKGKGSANAGGTEHDFQLTNLSSPKLCCRCGCLVTGAAWTCSKCHATAHAMDNLRCPGLQHALQARCFTHCTQDKAAPGVDLVFPAKKCTSKITFRFGELAIVLDKQVLQLTTNHWTKGAKVRCWSIPQIRARPDGKDCVELVWTHKQHVWRLHSSADRDLLLRCIESVQVGKSSGSVQSPKGARGSNASRGSVASSRSSLGGPMEADPSDSPTGGAALPVAHVSERGERKRSQQTVARDELEAMFRDGSVTEEQYEHMVREMSTEHEQPFTLSDKQPELVVKRTYDLATKKWKEEKVNVIIDWQSPIGHGSMRTALRMVDLSRPAGRQACVAKYVKKNLWDGTGRMIHMDVEMQEVCLRGPGPLPTPLRLGAGRKGDGPWCGAPASGCEGFCHYAMGG